MLSAMTRLIVVTLLLVLTFSLFAATGVTRVPLVAADKTVVGEMLPSGMAWPAIAANQDRTYRLRLQPVTNGPPIDTHCPNPCVGGQGCSAWETVENSWCRTVGGVTKECQPTSNRFCVKKEEESMLVDCVTCLVE
jgi:hypothetical protein